MNPEADGKLSQSGGTGPPSAATPPAVLCRAAATVRPLVSQVVWTVVWGDRRAPWDAIVEIQGLPWTCEKRTGPTKAAG